MVSLGIGDQGIGGMGIPVAKAAMHVAAGMVSPYKIAPIFIDMGTTVLYITIHFIPTI